MPNYGFFEIMIKTIRVFVEREKISAFYTLIFCRFLLESSTNLRFTMISYNKRHDIRYISAVDLFQNRGTFTGTSKQVRRNLFNRIFSIPTDRAFFILDRCDSLNKTKWKSVIGHISLLSSIVHKPWCISEIQNQNPFTVYCFEDPSVSNFRYHVFSNEIISGLVLFARYCVFLSIVVIACQIFDDIVVWKKMTWHSCCR
jgi:hypothetical protein